MWKSLSKRIKAALGVGLIVLGQVALLPTGIASAAEPVYPTPVPGTGPISSVQICHANNNDKDPYISNMPSTSGTDATAGHGGHLGPAWNPSLKDSHIAWGDIIPPFYYLANGTGDKTFYPGMNWNADSQLIWQYGCNPYNIPPSTMAPVITPSATACIANTDSIGGISVAIKNTNDPFNETVTYTVKVTNTTGYTSTQTLTLQDELVPNANNTALIPGSPYQGTLSFNSLPVGGVYTITVTGNETLPDDDYQTNYTTTINVSECHAPITITAPAQPAVTDPCGVGNVAWAIASTGSGTGYTWAVSADGKSVTYTAATGYNFGYDDEDVAVTSVTYQLPAETNTTPCPIDIPARPSVNDVCGLANATWIIPTNSTNMTWGLNANNELVLTLSGGLTFIGGGTTYNYGLATQYDSGELCVATTPQAPAPADPCGLRNAFWATPLPAATAEYSWVLGTDSHLYAYAATNYKFADGSRVIDFGLASDNGTLCPAPVVVEPTCDTAGTITLTDPDDGFVYHYAVTIGDTTIEYEPGTVIDGIMQGSSYSVQLYRETSAGDIAAYEAPIVLEFSLLNCIDIPETPQPADSCGLRNAEWKLPDDTDSVTWEIVDGHLIATAHGSLFTDGKSTHDYGVAEDSNTLCPPTPPEVTVYCGLYNNDQIVLPEVDEDAGYHWVSYWKGNTLVAKVIAHEGNQFDEETQTKWRFTDEHTACEMPELSTTPKTCLDSATVIVEYDAERYYYTIQLGDGEELPLDSGTTKLAKAGTYTVRGYEYLSDGDDERVAIIEDQEDGLAFIDTFTVTEPYCEPGKGAITPLPTPLELPHTGSDSLSAWLVAVVSAVAVYGAVYFAQPKRRYE